MTQRAEELDWLEPKEVARLTGTEPFTGSQLSVADFWAWAFSDLRTNIVRVQPGRPLRRSRPRAR